MKYKLTQTRRESAVAYILICALVVLALAFHVPQSLNSTFHDVIIQFFPHKSTESIVTILRYDSSVMQNRQQLDPLLLKLSRAKVRGVLLLPPKEASREWFGISKQFNPEFPVWEARRIFADDTDNDGRREYAWRVPGQQVFSGAWCNPELVAGKFRILPKEIMVAKKSEPCIEVVIGAALGKPIVSDSIYPDFLSGIEGIARISSTQASDLEWLEASSANKFVLLVPNIRQDHLLPVPSAKNDSLGVDEIEYHALVLDSVVRGVVLKPAPVWASLVLAALSAFLSLQVARYVNLKMQFFIWPLIIIPLLLTIGWLGMRFGHILFSLPAILSASIATLAYAYVIRMQYQERAVAGVIDRLRPVSQIEETGGLLIATTWVNFHEVLMEHLGLKRSAIFIHQGDPDRIVLQDVAGCNQDDIVEQRRDVRRTPYTQRLENDLQPFCTERPMFSGQPNGQYMMALYSHNQSIGYWAFDFGDDDVSIIRPDDSELIAYSNKIIQKVLLDQTRAPRFSIQSLWSKKIQWLRSDKSELISELKLSSAVVTSRLELLDEVIQSLPQACLVTDLLGTRVMANDALEVLAKKNQVPYLTMSAIEIFEQVCEISPSQARILLRKIIINRQTIELMLPRRSALQSIRLVAYPVSTMHSVVKTNVDSVFGIAFLFIPASLDDIGPEWTKVMFDEFNHHARNILEAMSGAWFASERTNTEKNIRLESMFNEKLGECRELLDVFQKQMLSSVGHDGNNVVPINLPTFLKSVVESHTNQLDSHGIKIELNIPQFGSLAFAQYSKLKGLLDDLILFLAEDTSIGGVLNIRVEDITEKNESFILVELRNTGFGMPSWHMKDVNSQASNNTHSAHSDLDNLRNNGKYLMQAWGGSFEVQSDIAKGFTVRICFRPFGLDRK
jgi:hypothetical protein